MNKKYKQFVRMYELNKEEIEMYKGMIRELERSLDKTREGNYRVADLRIEDKNPLPIYLSHEAILILIQEYKENIEAIEDKLENFYSKSLNKKETEISLNELEEALKDFEIINFD